jgi:hypothetical protein
LACLLVALPGCRRDDDPTGPGKDPNRYPIVSTFDKDLEGWGAFNDAQLNWETTGGNPGGYLRGVDLMRGEVWYFRAPSRILGNVSGAYGRVLSFDLYWHETTAGTLKEVTDDVMLVGAKTTLVWSYPHPPGDKWTSYQMRLDESGGWHNAQTGQPATRAEIEDVLRDLRELHIRGEFTDSAEQAGLDNVRLGVAP